MQTDKKSNDLQARHFVARDLERYVRCVGTQREAKKWAIEKPKLDSARRLRGILFIDPDDEEFKEFMKNARRKLEIPMPAAMLCKFQRDKYRETCRAIGEHKTKHACFV